MTTVQARARWSQIATQNPFGRFSSSKADAAVESQDLIKLDSDGNIAKLTTAEAGTARAMIGVVLPTYINPEGTGYQSYTTSQAPTILWLRSMYGRVVRVKVLAGNSIATLVVGAPVRIDDSAAANTDTVRLWLSTDTTKTIIGYVWDRSDLTTGSAGEIDIEVAL